MANAAWLGREAEGGVGERPDRLKPSASTHQTYMLTAVAMLETYWIVVFFFGGAAVLTMAAAKLARLVA